MKNTWFMYALIIYAGKCFAADGGYTSGSDSEGLAGGRKMDRSSRQQGVDRLSRHPLEESDRESGDESNLVQPVSPTGILPVREEEEAWGALGLGSPLHPDVAALLVRNIREREQAIHHVRRQRRSVSPVSSVRVPSRNEAGWEAVAAEDAEMERVERAVAAVLPPVLPCDSERPGTPVRPAGRKRMSAEYEAARAPRLASSTPPRPGVGAAWNPFDMDGVAQQTDEEDDEF